MPGIDRLDRFSVEGVPTVEGDPVGLAFEGGGEHHVFFMAGDEPLAPFPLAFDEVIVHHERTETLAFAHHRHRLQFYPGGAVHLVADGGGGQETPQQIGNTLRRSGRKGKAEKILVRPHAQVVRRHVIMHLHRPSVRGNDPGVHPLEMPHKAREIPRCIPLYRHRIALEGSQRVGLRPKKRRTPLRSGKSLSYGCPGGRARSQHQRQHHGSGESCLSHHGFPCFFG